MNAAPVSPAVRPRPQPGEAGERSQIDREVAGEPGAVLLVGRASAECDELVERHVSASGEDCFGVGADGSLMTAWVVDRIEDGSRDVVRRGAGAEAGGDQLAVAPHHFDVRRLSIEMVALGGVG